MVDGRCRRSVAELADRGAHADDSRPDTWPSALKRHVVRHALILDTTAPPEPASEMRRRRCGARGADGSFLAVPGAVAWWSRRDARTPSSTSVAEGASSLQVADHHVELGARPGGRARPRPSSRGRRAASASAAGVRGLRAVLEQGADEPALGRLVEVADHLALAVDLVQHPHRDHPRREVGRRPPERGVRRGPQVDQQPAARAGPGRTGPRASRQYAGHARRGRAGWRRRRAGTPGSGRRAGPARTATRRPRAAAGARRCAAAASVVEVEGVVQHAGVDPVGRARSGRSRSRALRRRPGRPGWRRGRASRGAASGSPRHRSTERVEHLARGRRSRPGRPGPRSSGLPRGGDGLALARRQQDQHAQAIERTRVVDMSSEPSGPGPRTATRWRAQSLRDGIAQIQARARGHARTSPPRSRRRPRARGRAPAAARPRPHRPPVRHHRPAGLDGPRPGAAPRARRRRLRRPLRDRRRRGVRRRRATRSTWRRTSAARRSTAPTPRCRCTRRCSPRAPPRCCPTRSGPALLWTIHVDADRRGHRRPASSGPGCGRPPSSTTRACSRPIDDGTRRRVAACCSRRWASCGSTREAARGGVSLPLPEQEVDVAGDRWSLEFRVAAPGRGVERPDLAAHRLRAPRR